jgi:mannitol/fructose-specific phosphotransferase system IIA component (Ntr-type)
MKIRMTDLIQPECISPNLRSLDKYEAFEEMTRPLISSGQLDEIHHNDLTQAIRDRERIMCTALGGGIAIPHAYLPDAAENRILVGRSPDGLDFQAPDGEPVYLVFLLVGPKRNQTEHLQIIAHIARMLHDEEFVRELREAANPESMIRAIRSVEARHA